MLSMKSTTEEGLFIAYLVRPAQCELQKDLQSVWSWLQSTHSLGSDLFRVHNFSIENSRWCDLHWFSRHFLIFWDMSHPASQGNTPCHKSSPSQVLCTSLSNRSGGMNFVCNFSSVLRWILCVIFQTNLGKIVADGFWLEFPAAKIELRNSNNCPEIWCGIAPVWVSSSKDNVTKTQVSLGRAISVKMSSHLCLMIKLLFLPNSGVSGKTSICIHENLWNLLTT